MAYRELELTLLSAQDLKSVNLITRMDVYAVVSISGQPLTRQCTEPDKYGGRNPCWNATLRFAVPPTAAAAAGASLHVLLRAERFLGDRDVGEVVVPLSDILAGATGVGPQPPQVASYQVRKLHRWEPRGVLNVSYRLGPVVAPVVERGGTTERQPVGVPPQPSHQHPSAAAYQPTAAQPSHQHPSAAAYQPKAAHQHPSAAAYQSPTAAPAPGPPAGRVVAEHDDAAAQNKSSSVVVMAYPVGVPQQQASHPPAKPGAYQPPTPPSPRPAAVHAARRGEAPARSPAPAPPPTNTRGNNGGFGQQPGPTHVYMGPHSQIIFGPPTRTTTSPASPAGKKGDGNWALLTQGGGGSYAPAAESISVSVISPRSRTEDRWRPSVQAAVSPQRLAAAAASPFSSRSSSSSSPLSPYSSGSPHPSPSSSAHSSTRSPYSSAHPSTTTSPQQPFRSPAAEVTHGTTNNTFRSRGAVVSSPLPSSSPLVPNHSRGAAVSSPLPSSSPTL